ncbi:MAG: hypothetical protein B6245_06995 [Desulfobacteraceae bacterium 4572_88]|nr:MAG: hypothetical protein B6245_06995 [Desulfobacteraceae bacterium 4572_88]
MLCHIIIIKKTCLSQVRPQRHLVGEEFLCERGDEPFEQGIMGFRVLFHETFGFASSETGRSVFFPALSPEFLIFSLKAIQFLSERRNHALKLFL